jgi:hypothetical protein
MDFNHHLPKEDITNTPTRHVHGKCNKHYQRDFLPAKYFSWPLPLQMQNQ